MSCGELTGDLKTNREESLTKHVAFVYAYAKQAKNIKINDEKGGDKQKKQESQSIIKLKTHFSLLMSDCHFEDALLILISGVSRVWQARHAPWAPP